jgi:hypothetical protein
MWVRINGERCAMYGCAEGRGSARVDEVNSYGWFDEETFLDLKFLLDSRELKVLPSPHLCRLRRASPLISNRIMLCEWQSHCETFPSVHVSALLLSSDCRTHHRRIHQPGEKCFIFVIRVMTIPFITSIYHGK